MFSQLQGVFYAVFDANEGPRVRCQAPDGVVIKTKTSEVLEPLILFESLRNYIIPKPALCNRLVCIRYGKYRIVGYPVNIVGDNYERNMFTFNFVFIFNAESDSAPYESAITRAAKMFKALEEQSQYLSNPGNLLAIDSAIEQIYQDLNSYAECQIPIDDSNKIDIKLFPILEAPPPIEPWHVPLTTIKLDILVDDSWDPTLERILPFINGVNSVLTIADLADADYNLTKQCIQHLIHYECVVILGQFQFSNVYATCPDINSLCDETTYREFCAFAYHPLAFQSKYSLGRSLSGSMGSSMRSSMPRSVQSGHSEHSIHSADSGGGASALRGGPLLSSPQVLKLYAAFNNGTNLYNWYNEHREFLHDIDVRRFLAFGVLKQLIYRVHAYPVLDASRSSTLSASAIATALDASGIPSTTENINLIQRATHIPAHMDSLCTILRASRTDVSRVLRAIGEWVMVFT